MTAEATAKQTTLEGTAEAGIVLSKGEAEAKALALRAEAYRQFNEAAVIQTVLSMLPEIVRAAAEPMANIGSLTVLSSDGASDVVKDDDPDRRRGRDGHGEGPDRDRHPGPAGQRHGHRRAQNGGPPPSPAESGGKGGGTGGGRSDRPGARHRRRRRRPPAGRRAPPVDPGSRVRAGRPRR